MIKNITKLIRIAEIVTGISGIIDLILWIAIKYHVPCYVVTAFSISSIMFMEVIKQLIGGK